MMFHKGHIFNRVVTGSPAEKAGIKARRYHDKSGRSTNYPAKVMLPVSSQRKK